MPFKDAEFEFIFEGEISVLDNVFLNGKMNKILEVKLNNDIIFCYQNWNIKTKDLNNKPRKLLPISVNHFSNVCNNFPDYKPSAALSLGENTFYLFTCDLISFNSGRNEMTIILNENMKSNIKNGDLGKGRLNLSTLPFKALNYNKSLNNLVPEFEETDINSEYNEDGEVEETEAFSFLYQDTGNFKSNENETIITVKNPKIVIAYQQWSFSTKNLNNTDTRIVNCLQFKKMVENANKYNFGKLETEKFTPTTTLIIDGKILIGVITNIVESELEENLFEITINFDLIENNNLKIDKPDGNNIDFFMNIDDTPSDTVEITVSTFIYQNYTVFENQKLNIPDRFGKCFIPEDLNFDNYINSRDNKHYLESFYKIGTNYGIININIDDLVDKVKVTPKIDSFIPVLGGKEGGQQFNLIDYHVVTLQFRELVTDSLKEINLNNFIFYDKNDEKINILRCEKLNPENEDGSTNQIIPNDNNPYFNLDNLIDTSDNDVTILFRNDDLGNISFTLDAEPYYYTFKTGALSSTSTDERMMSAWDIKYGRNVFSEDHERETGFRKGTVLNNTTYPLDGGKYLLNPNAKISNDHVKVSFFINAIQGSELSIDQVEFYDEDNNRITIHSVSKPVVNPNGAINRLGGDVSKLLVKNNPLTIIDNESSFGTIEFILSKIPVKYRLATHISRGIPSLWEIRVGSMTVSENYSVFTDEGISDYNYWETPSYSKYPLNNSFFMISNTYPSDVNTVTFWFKEILDLQSGLQLSEISFYDVNHVKLRILRVEKPDLNPDGSTNLISTGEVTGESISNLLDEDTKTKWFATDNSLMGLHSPLGAIRFRVDGKAKYYTFTTGRDNKNSKRMPLVWETGRSSSITHVDKTGVEGYTEDTILDETVYPLDGSKFHLEVNETPNYEVTFWFKDTLRGVVGNDYVNQFQLGEIRFYDNNNYEIQVVSVLKGGETNSDGTPNTIDTDNIFGSLNNISDNNDYSYWLARQDDLNGKTATGTIKFKLLSFPSYYTIRTNNGMGEKMVTSWSTTFDDKTIEENHIDEEGYTRNSALDNTDYPLDGSKFVLGNAREIVVRSDNNENREQKKETTSVLFEIKKMFVSKSGRPELELKNISFYDRNNQNINVKSVRFGKVKNNDGSINYLTESEYHPLANVVTEDGIWESINYNIPIDENEGSSSSTPRIVDVGGSIVFDLEKVPFSYTFTTGNYNQDQHRMMIRWCVTVNGFKKDFYFEGYEGFTYNDILNNSFYPPGFPNAVPYQLINKYNHASSSTYSTSNPPTNYGVPYTSRFYNGELESPWDIGYVKSTYFLIPEWMSFINKGNININKNNRSYRTEILEINNTHDELLLNSIITVVKPPRSFYKKSNWNRNRNFTDDFFNGRSFGELDSDVTNEFPCPNFFINEGTIEVLNDISIESNSDFSLINSIINQNGGVIKIPKIINKSTSEITVCGIRELINTENFKMFSENYHDQLNHGVELNSSINIHTVNSNSINCTTCGIKFCYINQGHIRIENVIAGQEPENLEENYLIDGNKKDYFDAINTYGIQYMGALNIESDEDYDVSWGVNQEHLRTILQAYKKISFKHKMTDPLSGYDFQPLSDNIQDIEDMFGNSGVIEIDNIKNFSNFDNLLANEVCCGIKNLIQTCYPEVLYYLNLNYIPNPILAIKKVINYGYGSENACMGVKNLLVNYGSVRIDVIDNKSPSNYNYIETNKPPFAIGIRNVVQNGFAFKNPEQFKNTPDIQSPDVKTPFSQRSFLPPFPPENYANFGSPYLNYYRYILPRPNSYGHGVVVVKYDQGHISIGLVNNSHQTENTEENKDAVSIGIERYGGLSFSPGIMDENNYDIFDVQDITRLIRRYTMKYNKLATLWAFPTKNNQAEDSLLRKKTGTESWTNDELEETQYFVNARNPVAMYYNYESNDMVSRDCKIFYPMNWGIVTINSVNSGNPDIPLYLNNTGSSLGIKHLITSLGSIQILSITSNNTQPYRAVDVTRYTKINTPDKPEIGQDIGFGNDYRELPLRYIDYDIVKSIRANENSDGNWTFDPPRSISMEGTSAVVILPRGHVNNVLDDRIHEDTEGVNTHYQNQMIATTGSGHQSNYRFPYGMVANDFSEDSNYVSIDKIDEELTNSTGDYMFDLMKCKGMSCGVLRTINYGSEAPGLWTLTDFSQPFKQSKNYDDYKTSYTKLQYSHLFKERFAAASDEDGYYRMKGVNVPRTLDEEGDEAITWFGQLIDQTDTFDDTVEEADEVLPYIVNNEITNYMISTGLFKNVTESTLPQSYNQSGRFFNGANLFPYITRESIPDPNSNNSENPEYIDDKLSSNGFRTDKDILFTDDNGNVDRSTYPLRPWTYQTLQTREGNILPPIYEWPFNYNFDDHNTFTSNDRFVEGTVPENNHMSLWPQFTNQKLASAQYLGWRFDLPVTDEDSSIGFAGPINAYNTVARGKNNQGYYYDVLSVDNFFRYHYNANLPPGFNPQFIQGGQLSFPELNRTNKNFVFQYGILKFDDRVIYADPYRWDGFATVSIGKKLISSLNPINYDKSLGEVTFYRQENTHDDYSWFRHKHETGNTYYGLTYEHKAYQSSNNFRLYYATFGPHYGLGAIIQNAAKQVFDSFVGNEQYLTANATQKEIDRRTNEAYAELGAQIGGSVVGMVAIAYAGGITAAAVGIGTAVTSAVYYGLGFLVCMCTVS